MTYQQQLTEVNTAITEILSGAQEYWYNSRKVRKADLEFLLKERVRLEPLAAQESAATQGVTTRSYARWPTR